MSRHLKLKSKKCACVQCSAPDPAPEIEKEIQTKKSHWCQQDYLSQKYSVSILLTLHTPPHTTSPPSSLGFYLKEAGAAEREQNMFVLFRALHPLWSSAGESTAHLLPPRPGFEVAHLALCSLNSTFNSKSTGTRRKPHCVSAISSQ